MNKKLIGLPLLAIILMVAMLCGLPNDNVVEAKAESLKLPYASMTVEDMQYLGGQGDSWNNINNSTYIEGANKGSEYRVPNNAQLSFTLNVDDYGGIEKNDESIAFFLRATEAEDDHSPINGFENSGYQFEWFGSGSLSFYKNGVSLNTVSAPTFSQGGIEFEIQLSSIDLEDGSTYLSLLVDNNVCFEYIDNDNCINGNIFAISTNGHFFTIHGNGESLIPFSLSEINNPTGITGYLPTSIEDGTVTFKSASYSGVFYKSQGAGSYAYKTNINFSGSTGNIIFNIGAKSNVPYPYKSTNIGNEYGYYVTWFGGANKYFNIRRADENKVLARGQTSMSHVTNRDYSVEMYFIGFDDGSTRVCIKVDNIIGLNYIDIKTSDNEPVHPVEVGSSSTGVISYIHLWTVYKVAVLTPIVPYESVTKNTHIDTLGTPDIIASSDYTIDRNGNIKNINGIVSYPTYLSNAFYTFNMAFDNVGVATNNLIVYLNYSGTPDNPLGSKWTKKGYYFTLRKNGNYSVNKESTVLCSGWNNVTNSYVFEDGENYTFKVGSIRVGEDSTRLVCYINDVLVINFIDYSSDIETEGRFTLKVNGLEGSLIGSDYSEITINAPDIAEVGDDINLSYSNQTSTDTYEYFISSSSTATASLNDNNLHISSEGSLVIYAKVNGIYSLEKTIQCTKTNAIFDEIVDSYVYGDENPLHVNAVLTGDKTFASCTYFIVEGSNIATIDNEGNIQLNGIGIIRVKAQIIDEEDRVFETDSNAGRIVIKPQNPTLDLESIRINNECILEPNINAPIPSGDSFTYHILEGNDKAQIINNTIRGLKAGEIKIEVVFGEGKDYEVSSVFTISVIGVEIISTPNNPIVIGNGDGVVVAGYADGHQGEDVHYYLIDNEIDPSLTGKANIEEDSGVIHYYSAGTVQVYAVVDGVETDKTTLVLNPKVEIGNAIAMVVGGERYLGYLTNCDLPEGEEVNTLYTITSGEEYLETFDSTTGFIKAKSIGVITIRVTISGDTFYSVSPDVQIAIENPIVTITKTINDMVVGQSQTIEATLGNEEIKTEDKSIVVTKGNDLVDIDDMTLSAKGKGEVSFYVVINGIEGISNSFVIDNLVATIDVGDMYINDSQQLNFVINDEDYVVDSVDYSVVEGVDLVSIDNENVIHSNGKAGNAKIKLVINNSLEAFATIKINNPLILVGLIEDKEYSVGSKIKIDYFDHSSVDGKAENVTFEVLEGKASTVVENNESFLNIEGDGLISVVVKTDKYVSLPVKIYGVDSTPEVITIIEEVIEYEDAKNGVNVSGSFLLGKENQKGVRLIIDNTTVEFNEEAVQGVNDDSVVFYFSIDKNNGDIEGSILVINLSFDNNVFTQGKATITTSFVDESDIDHAPALYYVDSNKVKTKIDASFNNGKLTFETNHFSTYAVFYDAIDKGEEEPKGDKQVVPSSSGLSPVIITSIVIGSVALVSVVSVITIVLVKKRKKKYNE